MSNKRMRYTEEFKKSIDLAFYMISNGFINPLY